MKAGAKDGTRKGVDERQDMSCEHQLVGRDRAILQTAIPSWRRNNKKEENLPFKATLTHFHSTPAAEVALALGARTQILPNWDTTFNSMIQNKHANTAV